MGPPPERSLNYKVSCLINRDTNDWDLDKIREICPFAEIEILKLKISRTGAPDKLRWMRTKDGEFSTKSGYHAAFAESNDAGRLEQAGNWNQEVWNLRTAPKTKMLIWKALRGALPACHPWEISSKKDSIRLWETTMGLCCHIPNSLVMWFSSCGLLWVLYALLTSLTLVIVHASVRTPNLKARLNTFREEFRAVWRNYSEL
ncbi:hypothetical protein F2Q70_00014081 [Brassica cretica]|uniref:Reverse transcriptase zinc-binding domain-containing protein n=1 Tax=Brassica cretica TaxID=69181 RepID=A0A8S9I2D4_BRACR|nr:hypothetical protein F2Q70_00014081 [Brassica cretica]